MKSIKAYLTEPAPKENAQTNEVLGVLLCTSLLAFCAAPLFQSDGMKMLLGGIGSMFAGFGAAIAGNKNDKSDKSDKSDKDDKDDKDDKSGKSKTTDVEKDGSAAILASLALAREANDKEKDATSKKKNEAMIDLLTACSFDKDGNPIPLDQRMDKMKDMMSPEQFESFKKDMTETYDKVKEDQKFLDALAKTKEKIKPEDYDKMIKDAKSKAKTILEQVEKEKREYAEYELQLNDIEEQLKDADDDKKKELEEKLKQLQQNPPKSIASAATGKTGAAQLSDEEQAELERIANEYKEQSSELAKEYQKKIDKETDPDKKKQLEEEWAKEEKKLSAKKNKAMDLIDDADEHDTENDETKQGKYEVKDEEIEDPETGKKIKVKTYTGPRGGKFYYPENKPHKPENKVYLESLSLTDYLYESMC